MQISKFDHLDMLQIDGFSYFYHDPKVLINVQLQVSCVLFLIEKHTKKVQRKTVNVNTAIDSENTFSSDAVFLSMSKI